MANTSHQVVFTSDLVGNRPTGSFDQYLVWMVIKEVLHIYNVRNLSFSHNILLNDI